jgi:meso-butanediol dehydrogenase/(S,S)-butanediol dehydrogenase/diacetyl reductase
MVITGRLAGNAAIVTGGSRGIGFGIAREFAREGANVLLVATSEDKLAVAKQSLSEFDVRIETLAADMGDAAACHAAVARAISLFGKLDILVNSAATYKAAPFLGYESGDFDRLMRVNLHGPLEMLRAALSHMAERGYGRVINVASTAGKWASVNQSAYNISKHAVIGLTRCVAMEFAAKGITVNALCPGMVQTDLSDQFLSEHAVITGTTPEAVKAGLMARIPEKRFLDIAECGHFAVYLASRESAGMTGQSILLDGGMLYV